VLQGGPYSQQDRLFSASGMLPRGSRYSFLIKDEYSDGMCCEYGQGSFHVTVDGEVLATGGQFKDRVVEEFDVEETVVPEMQDMVLIVKTDSYPTETKVHVTDECSGREIFEKSYTLQKTEHIHTMTLPHSRYKFVIEDSYSDGMCCEYGQGSFKLSWGGVDVCEGAEFKSSAMCHFGDGCV